ncbi:hypothetical protein BpHYR1_053020 [Brachionus plicatilis]|uniref:Uncharacterized protein n=1 Tax=Brachionus plicatilis TaxID=10195 RepID=A0A3M7S9Y7_BRAPC|nr:hypothetical protein BpHYR1_053020 [Brachionus plicatilis]
MIHEGEDGKNVSDWVPGYPKAVIGFKRRLFGQARGEEAQNYLIIKAQKSFSMAVPSFQLSWSQ